MKFFGYLRSDGRVGIRNYTLVITNGSAPGNCARMIASHIRDARCYVPPSEFGRVSGDRATIARTLVGLAANPNVGAVLIVGVKPDSGYPELSRTAIVEPIMDLGKPVDTVFMSECGGFHACIGEGIRKGRLLAREASRAMRTERSFGDLWMGVKCGYSDPSSGMSGNPVAGHVVDSLIDAGGTAFFSETTEVIGAEHLVARRFADPAERKRFLDIVAATEEVAKATGEDIRSINPVPSNIEAGITTLEEKSLGAVAKSGSRPIAGCLEYAERPKNPGLYFVDSWMATVTLFLGFTASGSVLNIFQVGGGWFPPQDAMMPGHSLGLVSPTLFMTGNPHTFLKSVNDIDFDAGAVITEKADPAAVAETMQRHLCDIGSGMLTRVETLNIENALEVYMRGPAL